MKKKNILIACIIILIFSLSVFCATPANSGKILYRLASPTGPTLGYTAANGW